MYRPPRPTLIKCSPTPLTLTGNGREQATQVIIAKCFVHKVTKHLATMIFYCMNRTNSQKLHGESTTFCSRTDFVGHQNSALCYINLPTS